MPCHQNPYEAHWVREFRGLEGTLKTLYYYQHFEKPHEIGKGPKWESLGFPITWQGYLLIVEKLSRRSTGIEAKNLQNSIVEKSASSLPMLLVIVVLIFISCVFVCVYRVCCYKKKKLIEEKKLKPKKKEKEEKKKLKPNKEEEEDEESD